VFHLTSLFLSVAFFPSSLSFLLPFILILHHFLFIYLFIYFNLSIFLTFFTHYFIAPFFLSALLLYFILYFILSTLLFCLVSHPSCQSYLLFPFVLFSVCLNSTSGYSICSFSSNPCIYYLFLSFEHSLSTYFHLFFPSLLSFFLISFRYVRS
jgi:hypothetical protein